MFQTFIKKIVKRFSFVLVLYLFIHACAPSMNDLPKLQEKLKAPKESKRIAAVKKIGKIKDATIEVLPILYNVLKHDSSPNVRKHSAESLMKLGFNEAVPTLSEVLKSESTSIVRASLINALCSISGESSIDTFIEFAKNDQFSDVRLQCMKCLFKLSSPICLEVTKNRLKNDPHWEVRLVSANILGNLKDSSSFDLLSDLSNFDSNEKVKEAAIIAIGAFSGERAINYLVEALKSNSLKEYAIKSIDVNNRGEGSEEINRLLIDYVDQDPKNMNKYVCNILLKNINSSTKQAFRKYYNYGWADDEIIRVSIDYMVRIKDFSLVPALISDLNNSSEFKVQVNLVQSLARFGDKSAGGTILRMLQNRSRYNSCLHKHLIWALGDGGLRYPQAYNYLCKLCCSDSDKNIRYDSCKETQAIRLHNFRMKFPKCPCIDKK